MPRKLKVATVQMDAAPAPTAERLERAGRLVAGAAAEGAALVVLPELFNTGYEYHIRNYALAEPANGPTMTWMVEQAARHDVHLAGSFLLLDGEEVYNSAFIIAPDGRHWRYDKIYPYSWERAYFHEGRGITVAETDLGKLGMLICWDSGHADLWRRYAGQVDAMVITSCPPSMERAEMIFPDGTRLPSTMMGLPIPEDAHFQDKDVEEQAGWMGVPVIASSGAGQFRSAIPMPELSLASLLGPRPDIQKLLAQAQDVILETGYGRFSKVIDAQGRRIARVESDGDGYALAEITLADDPPQPMSPQPKMRLPALGHFLIDALAANLVIPLYRQGVRGQWGARMAPVDPRTRMWGLAAAGAALAAGVLGYLAGRKRG
jgi:predicted amidohydrolase